MNVLDSKENRTYDVIVIGSGASGGWAAKEFCDKGLKTLVLERGRKVEHIKDYPTASKGDWELELRGSVPLEQTKKYKNARWLNEKTMHWTIEDDEQPYIAEKPISWFRGYHEGGRSLQWARAVQRWSDFDFEGPLRDGYAVDWPIRYKDLAPWYSHVEKFAGISGDEDDLDVLPNSVVMKGFEMNCIEIHFQESINKTYGDKRHVIKNRCAHLTDPQPIHREQGRYRCMHQDMCNRGCNFGGYFSSNASTLPWAMKTGNLTLKPDSIAHSIIYDDEKGKAIGVRVVDRHTKELIEYYAKVIFLNASTFNSNAILMNSTSNRFPNGLGNDNGLMGKFLTWHNFRGKASAVHKGYKDKTIDGRSPNNAYMPRFRNVYKQETDFLRGYAIGMRGNRTPFTDTEVIGHQLRENILHPEPGDWTLSFWMMGESVALEHNHMRLHKELKDKYDIPQIVFSCEWAENDEKMVKDFIEQSHEMFHNAGFVNVDAFDTKRPPASAVHEMGGIRMGHDPKTSLLNKHNQLHHCKNVFVTDGACMVSSSTQNPTLTYMALTARAANYAVEELNKQNF